MKISSTQLAVLRRLMEGQSVAASLLRKDFAEALMEEGLLTVHTHGSKRTFSAIDAAAMKSFLQFHFEELCGMDHETAEPYTTRSEQAFQTGNSKMVKVRSCPGFPVNSYEPVCCSLQNREFVVRPPEGGFVFIDDWQSFSIPADVVVVGIENMENFRKIRFQRQLFENEIGGSPLLFVSRYPQSTDLRKWLLSIPNRYVHFGDFDLAGIHIFLTEFHRYLGNKASFLIPADIEQRLAKGSTVRYNVQYNRFKNLVTTVSDLQHLIDTINNYRRCYDQEGYIKI